MSRRPGPLRLTYKQFAELVGATHGSVKRWVHEGLPVDRSWSERPRIDPVAGKRWLEEHPRPTVSHHRAALVYFARQPDGSIKIGFTSDVDRRLIELRKRVRDVQLLATLPGDKRLELRLHQTFAHHHLGEEWFYPGADLVAFIRPLARGA